MAGLLWNSDLRDWGSLGAELESVLRGENGFYADESDLLVRPIRKESDPLGIEEWIRNGLSRAKYIDTMAIAKAILHEFMRHINMSQ